MHSPAVHFTLRFFWVVLTALWQPCLQAQSTHQIFEHLTTEDGLSSDKVSDVIQDREGFYWISTQNGLNRFDGTSFQIFRNDPDDSTSLSHNSCAVLLEDQDGDIWVGTYAGVSRFSKDKGCFQQIYLDHHSQITDIANRINGLAMDGDGNIWISSFGLWKYDIKTDSVTLFRHDMYMPSSIYEDGYISWLTFDSVNNGIWSGSANAIQFYSIPQNQFFHARHNPLGWKIFDGKPEGVVVQDRQNLLWFIDQKTGELLLL